MSRYRHHTIIVTGWDQEEVARAREKAIEILRAHSLAVAGGAFDDVLSCLVSEIIRAKVNAYGSFCIVPDGSKEGWPESDAGDAARKSFLEWLDGEGSGLSYVQVAFGGDDRFTLGAQVEAGAGEVRAHCGKTAEDEESAFGLPAGGQ